MIQLVRITDALPEGFDTLVVEAAAEGIQNMRRLVRGWTEDGDQFQEEGEALLGAFLGGSLVGVGGLTIESNAVEPALRLRRFYVAPSFRRQGVARTLASALIQQGFDQVELLTVNAAASDAAGPFWEAQGFVSDNSGPWTHIMRRTQ